MNQLTGYKDAATLIDRSANGTPYEEPNGQTEQDIEKVWREVFGLDRIGRDDNFFELGGNSLLGMKLTDMLDQRLNMKIPVVALFLNPTIRDIATFATSA